MLHRIAVPLSDGRCRFSQCCLSLIKGGEASMKTSAKRTSKAAMVAEKDRAIVLAAHDHFLREGFAGTSMDAIAKSAGDRKSVV